MQKEDTSQENIREGDLVQGEYTNDNNDFIRYTGIVLSVEPNRLLIGRDDNINGGGPNGEWVCDKCGINQGIPSYGADCYRGNLKKLGSEENIKEIPFIKKTLTIGKEKISMDRYSKAIQLTQITY